MYLTITISVGVALFLIGAWALWVAIRSGTLMVFNPARFMVSGAIMALHQPVSASVSAWLESTLGGLGIARKLEEAFPGFDFYFWATVVVLAFVQVIVLPTSRAVYLNSLLARGTN